MPTNETQNDSDLGKLLNQAEPPKSPDHLDDLIIGYAKENVPQTEHKSWFGFLSGGTGWLSRHWISAAATFSVAVIAVSISLPYFDQPDQGGITEFASSDLQDTVAIESEEVSLQSPQNPELDQLDQDVASTVTINTPQAVVQTPAPSTRAAQPTLAQTERRERELNTAAQQTSATTTTTVVEPARQELAAVVEETVQVQQAAQTDTTAPPVIQQAVSTAGAADAAPTIETATVTDTIAVTGASNDAQVDEVLATSSFARQDSFNQATPSSVIGILQNDLAVRDSFIALLHGIVVSSDDTMNELPNQDALEESVQLIVETFEEISDPSALDQARTRYADARESYTDFELPETLEAAIGLLAMIPTQ